MTEQNDQALSPEEAVTEQEPQPSPEDRIAGLELQLDEQAALLTSQQQELETRDAQIQALGEELATAAAKYRALLLSGASEIPPELVTGETVTEVEASFQSARELVNRIRRQLEAKLAAERVPPGAPVRGAPDLSQLSPREKIAYALARR